MEYFSLGQIFKHGMMLNRDGQPYKHRASLSHVIEKLDYKIKKIQGGMAKVLTKEQIDDYNTKRIKVKRATSK